MSSQREIKLWKRFWFPLLKCFLLATYIPIFTTLFFGAINSIFYQDKPIKNYAELIPSQFWKPFSKSWFLSKRGFILLGIFLVFLYFLFAYFYELYAQKLVIKISAYLKNRTLKQFRKLPLEEQLKQKGKASSLIERDNEVVSYHWVNFWRNLYQGSLAFGLFLYEFFYKKWGVPLQEQQGVNEPISNRILFFTIFWIVLMVGTIWLFYKVGYRSGKTTKKIISVEHKKINQEINHSVLISSMGLSTKWEKKQQNLTWHSQQAKISTKKRIGMEKDIAWKLLINIFPFGLLILEPNFIGASCATIWNTLNSCVWAFGYLGNWSDYTSSRARVNTFLNLPGRNDNLKGIKISTEMPIKRIVFENVSFKYQGKKGAIIFNHTFVAGEINYLTTPNGSGKTTELYLLLGLLTSQKGKIIIEMGSNNISYNLSELNLFSWRSKNVAYCSHETLIKEGSIGQKQLLNIEQILKSKKSAQIFIFDEADNALDKEKQTWFQEQLKKLVEEGKIVICAR